MPIPLPPFGPSPITLMADMDETEKKVMFGMLYGMKSVPTPADPSIVLKMDLPSVGGWFIDVCIHKELGQMYPWTMEVRATADGIDPLTYMTPIFKWDINLIKEEMERTYYSVIRTITEAAFAPIDLNSLLLTKP